MSKQKLKFWNIPVTVQLDELLEKAVELDSHVSKADFVRDCVRRKLEEIGLKPEKIEEKPPVHV